MNYFRISSSEIGKAMAKGLYDDKAEHKDFSGRNRKGL